MTENNKDTCTTEVGATRYKMHKTVEKKDDGRLLIYYTFVPETGSKQQQAPCDNRTKAQEQKKVQE